MIFGMRWFGIKGETIGAGTKYAMETIRVQTSKDGAWQTLNDKELEQLLIEHNQAIKPRFDIAEQVKTLGADSLLPKNKIKKPSPSTKKKGKK